MLFNSFEFIFGFLPVTLLAFYWLGAMQWPGAALAWLVGASLFSYGWWNPAYLGLIVGSILFNYALGGILSRRERVKPLLVAGIGVNLALLGYFKYANFFLDSFNSLAGTHYDIGTIVLPLAISFFTFQQITFLVDAYRGETREYSFLQYCLFVTFFPQLIAGPIVHHGEMMPQFRSSGAFRLHAENVSVGLTMFVFGLFKKVVLADGVAKYATPFFDAAAGGTVLSFCEAWTGALAYTFQLYFDFSGYSDMAIGLARLFGIRLPLNFHSPYKAASIIEFWRRWHMTLSRFLRDYLYIPLGGNRKGAFRRQLNLMATMLLGGLWHGAGWTFVVWGGLHGLYLAVNHGWRKLRPPADAPSWVARLAGGLLTFSAVVIAWVFFRAPDLDTALTMVEAMLSFPDFAAEAFPNEVIKRPEKPLKWFLQLGLVVWLMPNTQQLLGRFGAALSKPDMEGARILWRPNLGWLVIVSVMAVWSFGRLNTISEFLYYQF